MKNAYFLGLDLGLRRDPSVLAFVQRRAEHLLLLGLKKFPLGLPYREVLASVARTARDLAREGTCAVVADGTGVGVALVEALRQEAQGFVVKSVTLTGGKRTTATAQGVMAPKADVFDALRFALMDGNLEVPPGTPGWQELRAELSDIDLGYRRPDDLATAAALAVWGAQRKW